MELEGFDKNFVQSSCSLTSSWTKRLMNLARTVTIIPERNAHFKILEALITMLGVRKDHGTSKLNMLQLTSLQAEI